MAYCPIQTDDRKRRRSHAATDLVRVSVGARVRVRVGVRVRVRLP